MAKYSVKIEFPDTNNDSQQEFNTALEKETGKGFKLLSVANEEKIKNSAEYNLEGNISLADLGSLVSRVSAKITRDYSFTILRQKAVVYN